MITHIEIEGFKSFEKVSLDLGGLNIFVGTNASGKSNFFDALRVLQGIGYGFTFDEIFNGKLKSANSEVWEPIRGGLNFAGFRKGVEKGAEIIRFAVRLKSPDMVQELRYEIRIFPNDVGAVQEALQLGDKPVSLLPLGFVADGSRPALQQFAKSKQCSEQNAKYIEICSRLLSNTQPLDPSPSILRGYSTSQTVGRMGDHGENFAGLVKSIRRDKAMADAYESWLKELTPVEIDKVVILSGAIQDSLFAIKRRGRTFPAPVLSDGTLRFAALAAAFFQPDMPETLLIEEIENGIHPTGLRVLVGLLKSQSANRRVQVMATSHSPLVLAWLKEDDYRTTFFCQKDEQTGASTITPLSSIPRLIELAREQSVADLFAEGWLETAV